VLMLYVRFSLKAAYLRYKLASHQQKVPTSLSQIATPVRQAYRSRSQVYFARVGLVLKAAFPRIRTVAIATKSANPTIADRDSGTTSIPESKSDLTCTYYIFDFLFAAVRSLASSMTACPNCTRVPKFGVVSGFKER